MKKIFLLVLFCCTSFLLFSQDFSNKGKDFWVGYGSHVSMYSGTGAINITTGGSQNLVLYFTSDQAATVTVTIPATGWTRTYTVNPNSVTESDNIPKTGADDARLAAEGVSNKGIHVTSDKPIVAYAHIYDGSVSGATLLFPTNTLGQDYYTLGFTQSSNSQNSYPFCFVIATEDNTTVEVTPSAATQNHAAGVAFTQVLQKGEILNLMGQLNGLLGVDLTGTRIRTVSTGTGGCKRIAVYCGTGKLNIRCGTTAASSADNTIQQMFPSNAWGKKYVTIPTFNMPNNFFRVMVNDPTTIVKLNGITLTGLVNSRYYQFQSNVTNIVEADKAIMVAQYITTAGNCGNTFIGTNGDPEMIYLSSVEQTINQITLNSTFHANITSHYINVVLKTSSKGTFTKDGVNSSASFITLPGDPTYSYAQFPVTAGIHNLYCDSGYNAIAYGYGGAESYGYNAGTNVIDLYQFVTLQNQYATVNFPATCKGTPFRFSITLPYQPIKLKWDFNQNVNLTPNDSVVSYPPAGSSFVPYDSTFVRDGKTLYVYKISQDYIFNAAGTYPIKVTANNPTADGCSGEQIISYDVTVYDQPTANFTFTHSGCISDSVKFFDGTNGLGRAVVKWQWDFGDASSDIVKNPLHKYLTAGTGSYNVHLTSYTDIGCKADTTKSIPLTSAPIAKFGASDTTCAGKNIVFTDSSSIAIGTIVKWFWDYGNGVKDTLTTNASTNQTYNTTGPYTITLKVQSSTGCISPFYSKTINVRTNPVPNFTLPIVCLPIGAAQFNNLTTINDGTIGTVSYKWNFGDGGTSTDPNPLHNYASTGPFVVKLTAISQYGCMKDSTKTLATVYPQPTANYTASTEVCLRDSTLFTDISNPGTGNSITKWYWNRDVAGGAAFVDTLQTFKYKYASAGTYTTKMYFVSDKGCVSDTMTKTTIVNVLPIALFTNAATICEMRAIGFTSNATPNAGNITRWYWDMGNGIINNFTNANTFNQTYAAWGTYTVKHMVETDKGCKSDTLSKVLNINPLPRPIFSLP
ncbi:MAG: PKD domain-containing protein, partial [Chitinophagaceae bacterium]|nr:PKD domain-containing protein [Chitinophagaceae bacterium]